MGRHFGLVFHFGSGSGGDGGGLLGGFLGGMLHFLCVFCHLGGGNLGGFLGGMLHFLCVFGNLGRGHQGGGLGGSFRSLCCLCGALRNSVRGIGCTLGHGVGRIRRTMGHRIGGIGCTVRYGICCIGCTVRYGICCIGCAAGNHVRGKDRAVGDMVANEYGAIDDGCGVDRDVGAQFQAANTDGAHDIDANGQIGAVQAGIHAGARPDGAGCDVTHGAAAADVFVTRVDAGLDLDKVAGHDFGFGFDAIDAYASGGAGLSFQAGFDRTIGVHKGGATDIRVG